MEELQHLLRLIEEEYKIIEEATQNIEKFTKRIESLVGSDKAAELISNILATQPLEEDQNKTEE